MSGREVVLGRIRSALVDVPVEEPADVDTARLYRRRAGLSGEELVGLFSERVAEYKATVRRCMSGDIGAAVADACRRRGVERLIVPPGIEPSWIPAGLGLFDDLGVTKNDLVASDGVVTGCRFAIAETGTIVLDGGSGQGRRALSLVPDYHLCVVRADQIVGTVPEAISSLETDMRAAPRNLTFISGPSATSDIEFRRVEGVHGPRTLEVFVIDGSD